MVEIVVDAKDTFFRMLRDPDGNTNLLVDGSTTPVRFRCGLTEGGTLELARVNFIFQANAFNEDGWFESNQPLANGVEFRIVKADTDVVVSSFNQEFKIRQNIHWGLLAGSDVFISQAFQGTKEAAFVRWTIERAGARVAVREDECFEMIVRDDVRGNNRTWHAMVQGFLSRRT